ncbi:MAG: DNA recombination protein RmuC [Alphaproteobacteria bacterium]
MPDAGVISLILSGTTLVLMLYLALALRSFATGGREGGTGDLDRTLREETARTREEAARAARDLREELAAALHRVEAELRGGLAEAGRSQNDRLEAVRGILDSRIGALAQGNETKLEAIRTTVDEKLHAVLEQRLTEKFGVVGGQLEKLREEMATVLHRLGGDLRTGLAEMTRHQNERLDAVRTTVDGRLEALRKDNEAKLEAMRQTVDEKLHATLEQRLGEKFGLVGQQLERVHQSVGEMQALAAGVGDLKRVLSNVKTRGTWGEVSLGALLDQVMTGDQIGRNVEIQPGSGERVEFAVRLPGRDDAGPVWLPIDAKFPVEDYDRLVVAADLGDKAAEDAALRALETRIRRSAQEICAKYVHPPHSTDFAIMYLPTEGLYAEVLRRPGLAESLNRDCRVVPAGPTTLTAMLNSLQMGFRTLAIEKRSSEVWQLLAAVKTEFGKYGEVLDKVQRRLQMAEKDIAAVRTRERVIGRRLRSVGELPDSEARTLLEIEAEPVVDEPLPVDED